MCPKFKCVQICIIRLPLYQKKLSKVQWCHVCNEYIIMRLPCWVTVWKSSSPEMCCVFFSLLNHLQVLESQHCCVATHQGATSKGGRARGSQPDPLPKKMRSYERKPSQKKQWHHCLVARLCVSNHLQFQPLSPTFWWNKMFSFMSISLCSGERVQLRSLLCGELRRDLKAQAVGWHCWWTKSC